MKGRIDVDGTQYVEVGEADLRFGSATHGGRGVLLMRVLELVFAFPADQVDTLVASAKAAAARALEKARAL